MGLSPISPTMETWSLDELLIALELYGNGNTHSCIAKKMDRSYSSVKYKLRKYVHRYRKPKKEYGTCKNHNCRKKFKIDNNRRKFCSRSCSASINNRIYKKKHKTKICKNDRCNIKIYSKYRYCNTCNKIRKEILLNRTLDECIYENHHKSSAFALVRSLARTIAKNNNMSSCIICGYDKHVEIDHIIPISEFPLNTKLSEVNDIKNLRPLCRNHHWEIRNGFV